MKPAFYKTLLSLFAAPVLSIADDARPSTFDRTKIARDPFARIDARLAAEQPPAVVVADSKANEGLETLCRVSAVSIDRLRIAVINGRAFAENEKFTVVARDRKISVTLLKVTEDAVVLDFAGTVVTVRIVRGV